MPVNYARLPLRSCRVASLDSSKPERVIRLHPPRPVAVPSPSRLATRSEPQPGAKSRGNRVRGPPSGWSRCDTDKGRFEDQMPRAARYPVGKSNGLDDDSKSVGGAAQCARGVRLAPCLPLNCPVLRAAPRGIGHPIVATKPGDGRAGGLGGQRIGGPALHVPVRQAWTNGRGGGEPARNEERGAQALVVLLNRPR
jgi:hypothetical protein